MCHHQAAAAQSCPLHHSGAIHEPPYSADCTARESVLEGILAFSLSELYFVPVFQFDEAWAGFILVCEVPEYISDLEERSDINATRANK
jgi:hypothetical protein